MFSLIEFCKDKETWKYIKTLLKVVTDVQKSESNNGRKLVGRVFSEISLF